MLNDRITTGVVRSTFTDLGVKPPKAVTDAFTRADRVTSRAERLRARPGDLEQAVTAALLADRDPADDPAVQSAATAQMLTGNQGLLDAVLGAAHDGVRDACLTHLDAIVGGWAKVAERAADELTTAHARLGNVALDDTTSILAQGGDVAAVWAQAQTSDATVDTAVSGWAALMQLVRVGSNPEHRGLRLAAMDLEQWRTLPAKMRGWDAVCAGLTISLPTLDEYRRRVATIQQAQAAPEMVVDSLRSAVAGHEIKVAVGR